MNMRTSIVFGLTLGAAVGLVGCGESIDSTSVKTDGIWADFTARADGSGNTDVRAGLKTGGPNSNTFLTLEEGDELTFHADGDPHDPNTQEVFDQYEVYVKNISVDQGGTEFRVEFTRENGEDAPNSSVVLPEKFQITAPSADEEFSRSSDDVTVEIDSEQQGTDKRVIVRGDCLNTTYNSDFSGTSVTIPADELESEDDSDAPDECEAEIEVKRIMGGEVDGAYEGGSFSGVQKRTTSFTSTP